jgi:hypothetical protein
MTFDTTIHIGRIARDCRAGLAVFKGGLGMRDAVRLRHDWRGGRLDDNFKDHEKRIRRLEYGDRRTGDRRT